MLAGPRIVIALGMLGAFRLASGAVTVTAPDTVATRVQTLLHANYVGRQKLAVVDRVITLEKRLGAYRAAKTKEQLVLRLNADLWVATRDRRISVHEQSELAPAGIRPVVLGQDLQLYIPEGRP
ncbi:hypothetical protein [Dyella choica]|uniref:Uncharacterized protein n=1 Tax=Dyella choica TaxID=1927959 RepID=A0A3S0RK77_9GAMM|nr:hypothetical protein [Dyella choica]RUL74945.1 hypothetical protein EKH80_12765 [Dyella choica]